MRTSVRIGNDIKLMWQILDGGVPVNLMNATDIKVSIAQGGTPSCNKIEITTFEVTDAVNGMIAVEVQKEVITKIGYLWAVLEYTVPDSGMIDGNRKVTTDNLPVKIVGLTDEASQDSEFTVSSDIQAGFQGKSAYEVWLVENPDKTLQDYFDWLQQPATDIEQVVSSNETVRISSEETRQLNETARVEAEALRQNNTAEAIQSANTAAQQANTARTELTTAVNTKLGEADGKIEEMNTTLSAYDGRVTQVESDIDQLAGDVSLLRGDATVKIENIVVNGDFANGETGWARYIPLSIPTFTQYADYINIVFSVKTTRSGLYQDANTVIGNKYYSRFVFRGILNEMLWVYSPNSTTTTTATGNWQTVSVLGTADAGTVRIGFRFIDQTGLASQSIDVKSFMTFNLSTIFGAGNEPTKEEMDLLISILGIEYFEGEITIPAQKIMQWELALIRKNKNAIIALGGTII